MMGYESQENQEKLFYYGFHLEQRVRPDHPLRKIAELIDFDFIYNEVKESYGIKGNVSIPPPVILKLMLLLILYNVRSERELMTTIPERLDWLWLSALIEQHQENTEKAVETVVADSQYGTVENFLHCHDLQIAAHIPDLKGQQEKSGSRAGIFNEEDFIYDAQTDSYRCPAGQLLELRRYYPQRRALEYVCARKVFRSCSLKDQCTRSRTGRSIKRHLRQEDLSQMRAKAGSSDSKKDLQMRQHLMEQSFARATRYGFKRARWRNLWRVRIQEYLTASIQNILILIHHVKEQRPAWANRSLKVNPKRLLIRLANCFWGEFPFSYLPKASSCFNPYDL